jgi:peptidoglycan lytic transglycosylase
MNWNQRLSGERGGQSLHRLRVFKLSLRSIVTAALLALLFTVDGSTASSQSLQSRANQIRSSMDARDFQRAEQLVRELNAVESTAFAANNYDYLLARLVERRGGFAEAQSLYLNLLRRSSVLSQYALWRLSLIARASGDLALERQYAARLIGSFPSSVLASRARERIIESHRDSRDDRATIALLKPLASPVGLRGRRAMAQLGEAYARIGETASARAAFEQLIAGSRDDYALRAALGLDALDRAQALKPDEFDALRRARVYLTNRHWTEARAHMANLADRFADSPNRAEALYQIGFTFYRQDRYDEAIVWFERAHAEFPSKKEGEQGFYWVATALQKAQRYDEAMKRYSDFIESYPNSELVDAAYRNVVDCLRYGGKDTDAIQWSRRIVERSSREPLAVVGLFNEARIELGRGNWEAALTLLNRLQAQPSYQRLLSAPMRGEAGFLRIVAIEQMGRLAEAARLYFALRDERDNYFGQRATQRLVALTGSVEGRRVVGQLAGQYHDQARAALRGGRYAEAKDSASQALRVASDSQARRELLEMLRSCYSQLPAYNAVYRFRLMPIGRQAVEAPRNTTTDVTHAELAAELLFLGLYDEGSTELKLAGFTPSRTMTDSSRTSYSGEGSALDTSNRSGDIAYSIAVYSNRGDQSNQALQFAEPLFKSVPQDYRLELMPRDLAELMYPAPYRDALNRYSSPLGVDPRLVLALARQESRFDPSVKSQASARGLLQFIPETAEKLANEEGMRDFELDDVYDPQIAVRLSVRYVANLLKLFPNNPHAVAASYNTGEQNVERWVFRSRSTDTDRFVAEIAIPETKDYVAKVMANYWAYRQLYTEDLRQSSR